MLALAVTSMANAQEGTILVGGNVGITSEKVGDDKYSTFEFSPTVGYQFNENMTVGLQTSISNSKDERSTMVGTTMSVSEYTTNTFKIGAFYRYAKPLSDLFAVYADVAAGYQTAKAENAVPGMPVTSLKSNGFYAGITPALFINMKNSFGLNFSIGGLQYNSMTTDTTPSVKSSGFDFNFGKTLNIGISKNF